jgi:hypothetical protein
MKYANRILALFLPLTLFYVPSVEAAKSYSFSCPNKYVMVGLHGSQGSWMNGVTGRCAKIRSNGTIDLNNIKYTRLAGAKLGNDDLFNKTKLVKCPKNKVLVGFTGNTGTYVNAITTITCRTWDRGSRTSSGRTSSHKMFPLKGKGTYSQTLCPDGAVGLGIKGKHGSYLDRFAVKCGLAPGAEPKTVKAPSTKTRVPTVRKSPGCNPSTQNCSSGGSVIMRK